MVKELPGRIVPAGLRVRGSQGWCCTGTGFAPRAARSVLLAGAPGSSKLLR